MTAATDLSTTYLGFHLPHPFIVGASPLVDHLDTVRRLEDAGCAAIVMHSLFEEQITAARSGRIHHLDPLDQQFATVLSYFPESEQYALGPDEYLEQLRRIKSAVKVPVVASLNGTSAESWLTFAQQIQQAGADALELNMYTVVTDPKQSGAAIEHDLAQVVQEAKRRLKIPIAVKVSPFFTAFGHVASELDRAGADGLVLFNRFYQPDFDVQQTDRHTACRAVEQFGTVAAPSVAGHPARPCPPVARRVWRCRTSDRRHQGFAGRCPRGTDGIGHSPARACVPHRDARWARAMDGVPWVREARRRARPAQSGEQSGPERIRARQLHSNPEQLERALADGHGEYHGPVVPQRNHDQHRTREERRSSTTVSDCTPIESNCSTMS